MVSGFYVESPMVSVFYVKSSMVSGFYVESPMVSGFMWSHRWSVVFYVESSWLAGKTQMWGFKWQLALKFTFQGWLAKNVTDSSTLFVEFSLSSSDAIMYWENKYNSITPNNCNSAGCISLGKAMEKKKRGGCANVPGFNEMLDCGILSLIHRCLFCL